MRCLAVLVCLVLVCSTGVAIACEEPWPLSTPISTILPPMPLLLVDEDAEIVDEDGEAVAVIAKDLEIFVYESLRLVEVQKSSGSFLVRDRGAEHYTIANDFAPSFEIIDESPLNRVEVVSNATYFRVEHCLLPTIARANFAVRSGYDPFPDRPDRTIYYPTFERDDRVIAVFPDGSERLIFDGPCAMAKDLDDPARRWRLGAAIALLLLAGWLVHRQR